MKHDLMGILCTALICAVVNTVCGGKPGKRKLLTGMLLALSLLSALNFIELPELELSSLRADAAAAAAEGEDQAAAARSDIISDACEAYILSKAAALGLELQTQVTLDDAAVPVSVTLTGAVSPSERETLSGCIARDLGLGKEAQTWIDPYQSSD